MTVQMMTVYLEVQPPFSDLQLQSSWMFLENCANKNTVKLKSIYQTLIQIKLSNFSNQSPCISPYLPGLWLGCLQYHLEDRQVSKQSLFFKS